MSDPFPGYRFLIALDPGDFRMPTSQADLVPLVALGQFQEVKGLGAELEVFGYAEGGLNDFVHQLPVRHSWQRITLRRGLAVEPGLYFWYAAGLSQSLGARRNGAITLLTPDGTPAMAWSFFDAIATKWMGPDLSAMQNTIAIEGIEIAHQGLLQIPLMLPGIPALPGLPSIPGPGVPGIPGL
jgi:phage tail-like protein